MELFSWILLFLLLAGTFLVQALRSVSSNSNGGKLPPGPIPFPVIGNLLELGDKPHKSLAKLAKIHGPIISLKLGRITTIVVSSAEMAKQVLQTHDQFLSNRTIPASFAALKHDQYSLPLIPVSPRWRNLRKICNNQLFATKVLDANQSLRRKKLQELLAEVHRSSLTGEAIDIGKAVFKATLNLLSNTFYSVDFADPNSDEGGEFKEMVWNVMKEGGNPNLADFFPVLKMLDPQGRKRRMTIQLQKLVTLFGRFIDERLELRKASDFVMYNDTLDTLLNISEQNSDEMDKERIERLSVDLFVAGTDTTTTTIEWAMAELLKTPKTMSKAKAELEKVIGKKDPVVESDITSLPYLQAIIKETFRLHSVVPLLLPRKAKVDVEIGGYCVPKGAQVLVNVWAIGRDPSIWENPNEFIPERFMGSEIDVKGRNFELTPFGSGRRICPGLPLAMRMLHLMLGSLLNSFDWRLEDGVKPEDINMEDKFGLTLQIAQPLRAVPVSV
ncbi:putative Cytochrome P450 [Quillaja saponaria]|uniref:Cytochrome P450 n=1 Tax=Quillaja saponaria TaxID=32244 RepID=A0AAD7L6D5_QUISA|nr:putative Cytochrome P450 [Quillaja saponaria]